MNSIPINQMRGLDVLVRVPAFRKFLSLIRLHLIITQAKDDELEQVGLFGRPTLRPWLRGMTLRGCSFQHADRLEQFGRIIAMRLAGRGSTWLTTLKAEEKTSDRPPSHTVPSPSAHRSPFC